MVINQFTVSINTKLEMCGKCRLTIEVGKSLARKRCPDCGDEKFKLKDNGNNTYQIENYYAY